MYAWSDMAKVKKDLWNKLHAVKQMMGKQFTQLAQIVMSGGQNLLDLHSHIQSKLKRAIRGTDDGPVLLSQVNGKESNMQTQNKKRQHTAVSSTKNANTKGTMLLYFCIMTVLIFFCLGRCLVVPLSQASKFELNSRKHVKRLDKDAIVQQKVIQ